MKNVIAKHCHIETRSSVGEIALNVMKRMTRNHEVMTGIEVPSWRTDRPLTT